MQPSQMTISDMKLRVAERVSVLKEVAGVRAVPTDAGNADRFARALQDGIDEFCDEGPWAWQKADYELTLSTDGTGESCIAASAVRYRMPEGVSAIPRVTEYAVYEPSGSIGGSCHLVSTMEMERFRARDGTMTGAPQYVCFGMPAIIASTPSNPTANGRPVMQMQVYPIPDKAYRLKFPVFLRPTRIVADNGPIPWFAVHDHTVIAFATRAFMRVDVPANSPALANAQIEAERRLAISRRADAEVESAPIFLSNPTPTWVSPLAVAYDYDGTRMN